MRQENASPTATAWLAPPPRWMPPPSAAHAAARAANPKTKAGRGCPRPARFEPDGLLEAQTGADHDLVTVEVDVEAIALKPARGFGFAFLVLRVAILALQEQVAGKLVLDARAHAPA